MKSENLKHEFSQKMKAKEVIESRNNEVRRNKKLWQGDDIHAFQLSMF